MAMDEKMSALILRGTWELVDVPPNANVVACRWVFTLKFRADGTLKRYKARLFVKSFTKKLKLLIASMGSLYLRENMLAISFKNEAYLALNRWTISWILILISGMMIWKTLQRLLFKQHGHVKIKAYSDAHYAGLKDDRKSTFGYCTYVGGNLVTWRKQKQTTVARSSTEAEYRAMAHMSNEVLWLKNLLKELGIM
ncbi:UNVERIFIED_CONTAM: Retrovirus-related Pol polyprotein from transposon RE1 [Sesamum radiatum]|uniref:Retrovirus-related Pol polyprotein from transposon RE1 n=1 Tax=Sesamum radiatum TaxID=300843 RepID=A0AAW2TTU6_SESRA